MTRPQFDHCVTTMRTRENSSCTMIHIAKSDGIQNGGIGIRHLDLESSSFPITVVAAPVLIAHCLSNKLHLTMSIVHNHSPSDAEFTHARKRTFNADEYGADTVPEERYPESCGEVAFQLLKSRGPDKPETLQCKSHDVEERS